MEKISFRRSLVVGIIVILIGASIVPNIRSHSINQKNPGGLTTTNLLIDNPSKEIEQFELLKLFMIYINGTGETSTELEEMNDGFKLLFIFDFINDEAELRLGFLGLPLWEIFPCLFNHVGPQRYKVIGFLGDIQKIDDAYHIEGYCFRISGRSLP